MGADCSRNTAAGIRDAAMMLRLLILALIEMTFTDAEAIHTGDDDLGIYIETLLLSF